MNFEKTYNNSPLMLIEGPFVERLKSEYRLELDSFINHAGEIYKNPEILETLYKQYISVARKYDFPIMIMTPTRKVNFETLPKSKFSDKNLIADSCSFLNKIRNEYDSFSEKIFVGGLLGCRGDAYKFDEAMNISEAYNFHKIQVNEFKNQQIDFLFAGIMPTLNEAIGMALAMSTTELPYIISFMIRKDGCLLDGTSITQTMDIIDNYIDRKPLVYMTNCVHPLNLKLALSNKVNLDAYNLNRFVGIQANSSALSPEELNNCGILHQDNFDEMIDEMIFLRNTFKFKIFGGCCGTDEIFFENLAKRLKNSSQINN